METLGLLIVAGVVCWVMYFITKRLSEIDDE